MAAVCPIGFDRAKLNEEVRRTYACVALNPDGEFHFHRGPYYAARQLGYGIEELLALPAISTAPFAGVGNPFKMGPLPKGGTVLDVGSGAGMDCLIAGKQVGADGQVVGVDMTDEMLARARQGAREAGLSRVRFEKGDMAQLPLEDESVDVVISNGVINLAPDKTAVFAELYRVVRPGGRLQFADIIIGTELSENARNDIDLWAG